MTSPDGAIPGGAVNYGSLADYAAKTELDWNVEIKEGHLSTWGEGGLLGHLFQDLARGKPLVIAILGSLADALGLGGVWDTVESVVSAIAGFIGGIVDKLLDAFTWLARALGLDKVWDTLEDVVEDVGNWIGNAFSDVWDWTVSLVKKLWGGAGDVIGDVIDIFVDSVHTLGDFFGNLWAGSVGLVWDGFKKGVTDVWRAIWGLFHKADEAEKATIAAKVFGSWIGDPNDDVSFAQSLIDGRSNIVAGRMYLAPITIHHSRPVEAIKVGMYGIPGACHMSLWRVVREDYTDTYGTLVKAGTATLVKDLGNVTEILRSRSTDLKVIPFKDTTGDETLGFAAQELLYVAVVQTGSTVPMATWSQVTDMVTGHQPKALGLAHTGTGFNGNWPVDPSSGRNMFVDTAVTNKDGQAFLPQIWAALGSVTVNTSGPDNRKTFVDSFDVGATPTAPVNNLRNWVFRMPSELLNEIPPQNRIWPQAVCKRDLPASDNGFASPGGWWSTYAQRLGTLNQQIDFGIWWKHDTANTNSVSGSASLHGDGSGSFVSGEVIYDYPNRRWVTSIYTHADFYPDNRVRKSGPDYFPFSLYNDILDNFRLIVENGNTYSLRFQRKSTGDEWFIASEWVDFTDAFPVTESSTEFGLAPGSGTAPNGFRSVIDNVIAKDTV